MSLYIEQTLTDIARLELPDTNRYPSEFGKLLGVSLMGALGSLVEGLRPILGSLPTDDPLRASLVNAEETFKCADEVLYGELQAGVDGLIELYGGTISGPIS